MEMKIPAIGAAITTLVVIVVLAGVLIPTLEDAKSETKSVALNTTEKFLIADFDDNLTITIEYLSSNTVSVNGETFTVPSAYYTVGFSDSAIIRLQSETMVIFGADGSVTPNIVKIVYNNGIATLTNSSAVDTVVSWSYLFYPSPSGTWGYFQDAGGLEEDVIIDNTSVAYIVAWVSWNNTTNSSIYGSWKIQNGVATLLVPAHYQTSYNGTFYEDENAAVDLHYTDTDDGLGKLYTGATFTINGYEYSDQAFIIAPLEYHYRSTSDNSIVGLYDAIPILVIVALLIAVVAMVFRSRQF